MNDLMEAVDNTSECEPPFTVDRISNVAGAEIRGIDVSGPITPDVRDAILEAFAAHHVLAKSRSM